MNDTITHPEPVARIAGEESKVEPTRNSDRSGLPAYIRLPRCRERCPYTGLTRSSLNKLILGENPKVASVLLAEKGKVRGVRLIHLQSLLDYIDSLFEGTEELVIPEPAKGV